MEGAGGQLWTVLAVVAGVGVLALLHFLASGLRNATNLHDVRVKVARLRKDRLERRMEGPQDEIIEVGEAGYHRRAA